MEKILLLGSNHPSTAEAYRLMGLDQSTLVTSADQDYNIGHTAIQEFDKVEDLEKTLSQSSKVFWIDPEMSEFPSESDYYDFLEWLKKYQSKYGNVVNFDTIIPDPYRWKVSLPKFCKDDAVFFGCSFTAGAGLSNKETRWANLVSRHFEKNCVNLGRSGSSNLFAFDMFSQCEFVPGQIVVWQITFSDRIFYCNEDQNLEHIILSNSNHRKHKSMIDVLTLEHMMFELTIKVRMIVKMSRLLGLKFVFWLSDYKEFGTFSKKDIMCFYEYPEFIPAYKIQNYMVDGAEDNVHPGIKSNKIIADIVIEHIENLYT